MVFMCHVYFWTCSWETCWGPPWWRCRCSPRICSHWPCHDTYNGFDVPCVFWNMFLGNLLNFPLLSFLMFTCSSSNRSHPKCQVWHIKSTYYTWFCLIGDSPSSQKCNLRNFIIFWIFDLDFDLGLEKIISDINLSNIKMFQTSTNFKTAILNFVNFHSKNMRLHYIVPPGSKKPFELRMNRPQRLSWWWDWNITVIKKKISLSCQKNWSAKFDIKT